jgi:hypothetical protein
MDGIPKGETNLRKAQRLQSKAFLLFFDQLLADYLKQLDQLKHIFTWRGAITSPVLLPLQLSESMIKDLSMLLESDSKAANPFNPTYIPYTQLIETPDQQKQRRNRLLDHLLARFNELFVDYSVFKFRQNKEGDFFGEAATEELIDDKMQFLNVYSEISGGRSHAFIYTKTFYPLDINDNNIAGLQLRIQKMLGLVSSQNKKLAIPTNVINYKVLLKNIASGVVPKPADKLVIPDNRFDDFDSNFGIHVLEHILLRPFYKGTAPLAKLLPLCGDGSNNEHAECLLPDNYSMQMTVVAPGWLSISNNMDFRAFTESLIRTEAPAHVTLKICWLDPALMYLFEQTTEAFFVAMAKVEAPGALPVAQDITDFNAALLNVYTMMGLLKNMYLPSIIDECDNINYNAEADKIKVPVILDYSALGSDGKEEWFVFEKQT